MRARYCDVEDREWFSQRRAFLNELDMLFADAKEHKVDLKFIEEQIESEKEAWYRWVLRMYPEFLTAGESGVDQEELRGMLDDPDRSRQELIESVWKGVGKPATWSSDVDTFADKMASTKNSASELKKLYVAYLFKDRSTGAVLEHAQKYLDVYESSDAMPLEEVINRIVQDHRASRNTQPQRDGHEARLDELRRARTAFEQNRLQAKSRLQAAQAPAVADELYNLPPCAACQKQADPKDVFSCSLCQVMVQIGAAMKLTVYCSTECFHEKQDEHVDKEHDCEAGDECVQNVDVYMESMNRLREPVVCNDCMAEKQSTIYCSMRCAMWELTNHRVRKHGANTAVSQEEVETLVSPLWKLVDKTLEEGSPGLKYLVAE
ncbi:hypothetical protein QQX98_011918 [Neonectria punicea]|uniref:MYND-type domain-containing protein n=1 Tax=Neonectria punicea TaxID=979145 RepID=A0ABR1GKK3_9HYPO